MLVVHAGDVGLEVGKGLVPVFGPGAGQGKTRAAAAIALMSPGVELGAAAGEPVLVTVAEHEGELLAEVVRVLGE